MKRAQAQALGSSSAERFGWEEEFIKETEKKELPVREEGNQESTVPQKPGEGCCDEAAVTGCLHVQK